jgi:hypothetical protein
MRRNPTTAPDRKHRVAGEDPRVLLPLLARLADSMVQNDDGTFHVHVTYGKDEAPPLVRALMRIEAELLLEDARRLGSPEDSQREPGDRSVDALVLLVLRTTAALGQPVDAALLKRFRSGRRRHTHQGVA